MIRDVIAKLERVQSLVSELAPLLADLDGPLRDAAIAELTGRPATAAEVPSAKKPTAGGRRPRGEGRSLILAALAAGPKTTRQLVEETGLPLGTVAHVLHQSGMCRKVDEGRRRSPYELNDQGRQDLSNPAGGRPPATSPAPTTQPPSVSS